MELLLLLSAFLTALNGAITGARPVQVATQAQVVVAKRTATSAVRLVPTRPAQGWPMLAIVIRTIDRPLTIASDIPVFGKRRRE